MRPASRRQLLARLWIGWFICFACGIAMVIVSSVTKSDLWWYVIGTGVIVTIAIQYFTLGRFPKRFDLAFDMALSGMPLGVGGTYLTLGIVRSSDSLASATIKWLLIGCIFTFLFVKLQRQVVQVVYQ